MPNNTNSKIDRSSSSNNKLSIGKQFQKKMNQNLIQSSLDDSNNLNRDHSQDKPNTVKRHFTNNKEINALGDYGKNSELS